MVKASVWLPFVAAVLVTPVDFEWKRPAAASFVAFFATFAVLRWIEGMQRRRRLGAEAWTPSIDRHFAFAFAYPTRRRRLAAAAALVAAAAVGFAQMQLRRGQFGFLRAVPDDLRGLDYGLTYAWRAAALFGTGAVVGFGARWIHLREVQASMGFDRRALQAALADGRRAEAVKMLTSLFFQPGWEREYRGALEAARGGFDTGAFALAAGAAEAAAARAESARASSPIRSLTDDADEERLRAALWRALQALARA